MDKRRSARLAQPGAELLDRIEAWRFRHGRTALLVLAGVAVVAGAVLFTVRSRAQAEEQASARLAEASMLYWQGQYERSQQLARATIEEYGSTPSGIDALRLAGDNAFWTGEFTVAVAEYRRYLAKRGSGVLADAERRSLAYALESDQKFLEAAAEYEGLIGRFDRGSSAEFLAAAARCRLLAGQPAQALPLLERLVDEFGETPAAEAARIEIAELKTRADAVPQP